MELGIKEVMKRDETQPMTTISRYRGIDFNSSVLIFNPKKDLSFTIIVAAEITATKYAPRTL